jgi:hypothetical protein
VEVDGWRVGREPLGVIVPFKFVVEGNLGIDVVFAGVGVENTSFAAVFAGAGVPARETAGVVVLEVDEKRGLGGGGG